MDTLISWRHGARIDVSVQILQIECVGENTVEELIPMQHLDDEDDGDVYEARVKLKEGSYRMRFLVDGEWNTDNELSRVLKRIFTISVVMMFSVPSLLPPAGCRCLSRVLK